MVVEDNTFLCGFCIKSEPKKRMIAPKTYKIQSNRPCSTCILPLMLVLDKPSEPEIEIPKDVKGWKV